MARWPWRRAKRNGWSWDCSDLFREPGVFATKAEARAAAMRHWREQHTHGWHHLPCVMHIIDGKASDARSYLVVAPSLRNSSDFRAAVGAEDNERVDKWERRRATMRKAKKAQGPGVR